MQAGKKGKSQADFSTWLLIYAGNDLLSHTLSRAVQSALRGLTSVFGMGTGGTPAVKSPQTGAAGCSLLSYWLEAHELAADFIIARHQSGFTGVFPAQRP